MRSLYFQTNIQHNNTRNTDVDRLNMNSFKFNFLIESAIIKTNEYE